MKFFLENNRNRSKFLPVRRKVLQLPIYFLSTSFVKTGIVELDDSKLQNLLELKYNANADAVEKLGDIPSIRNAFIGFQGYLYEQNNI